jgi:PAS domain S-box-containing protein
MKRGWNVNSDQDFQWPPGAASHLLSLTADLACVAGFDGFFRQLSNGWAEALGYRPGELLDRPFVEFVQSEDVIKTNEVLADLRGGVEMCRFENRFVASDGTTRWLSWTAVRDKEVDQYYAVARNLTAQHEAEVGLTDTEKRYLDLIESSHDVIQSNTLDGQFEFVNKAWHDMLGYTPAELPNVNLYDIIDPSDHTRCQSLFGQVMQGHDLDRIEVLFLSKDGRQIPVEGNATSRFHDGEFYASHSFFRDISERKKAEELSARYQKQLEQEIAERTTALVQSEKLATLGRLSAGMAHELNNPAAAARRGAANLERAIEATRVGMFDVFQSGLGPEQVRAIGDLLGQTMQSDHDADDLDALSRSDVESDMEDWLEDHGVEEPWELAASLVELGVATGDLEQLSASFDERQIGAVTRMIGMSQSASGMLGQVTEGTRRVSEIVTALKTYSYMDRASIQSVDIHETLDNTLIMLQGKLKGSVEVDRTYDKSIPVIETHGSELNQVWTNLIDNAVDAMSADGKIRITTHSEDDGVRVEVSDNGPGIPPDQLSKIFDPFFTTKQPGEGTGLGLNIVYNIIKNQGGEISAHSEPGHTAFTVTLPLEITSDRG